MKGGLDGSIPALRFYPDSAIGGLHRRRRIATSGLDRRHERVGRDLRRGHHCYAFGLLVHSNFANALEKRGKAENPLVNLLLAKPRIAPTRLASHRLG